MKQRTVQTSHYAPQPGHPPFGRRDLNRQPDLRSLVAPIALRDLRPAGSNPCASSAVIEGDRNARLTSVFSAYVPSGRLVSGDPILRAFQEAAENAKSLPLTTILLAVRIGSSIKILDERTSALFHTAIEYQLGKNSMSLADIIEFLALTGASRLAVPVLDQVNARLPRDENGKINILNQEFSDLFRVISNQRLGNVPLARALFASLFYRTYFAIETERMRRIEGDSPFSSIGSDYDSDTIRNNIAMLRGAAQWLDLTHSNLIRQIVAFATPITSAQSAPNYQQLEILDRALILQGFAEIGLAGTSGLNQIIDFEASQLALVSVDKATEGYIAVTRNGLATPAFEASAAKFCARLQQKFLAACAGDENSELIRLFYDIRRAGFGDSELLTRFQTELTSRYSHAGKRSGSNASDVLLLGELLARDRSIRYDENFRHTIVTRLDEHLHDPADRQEAVALAFWLLALAPEKLDHCTRILTQRRWLSRNGIPEVPNSREVEPEITKRGRYLLGFSLGVDELYSDIATVQYRGEAPDFNEYPAFLPTNLRWAHEECVFLKQKLGDSFSLELSDGGVVAASIGRTTVLVGLPIPQHWHSELSQGFDPIPVAEAEVLARCESLERRILYVPIREPHVTIETGEQVTITYREQLRAAVLSLDVSLREQFDRAL